MKKYISILLFGMFILGACKKVDLFDYELPEGRISGVLVSSVDNTPVPDIFVLIENNDNDWLDITFSQSDGYFSINRMAGSSYTLTLLNDSLIMSTEVTLNLGDGEDLDVGNVPVELAPLPVFEDFTILLNTAESVDIRVDVNDGGNRVWNRGVKYLPASDPGDPAEDGTEKNYNWRENWDLTYWEQSLTELDPETDYKLKTYIRLNRGLNEDGTTHYFNVYSEEYTFTTPAAAK